MTISYPLEEFESDPTDNVIVDTWFQSQSLRDYVSIANYLKDPSLNSLSVRKNTIDGKYPWTSMYIGQAKEQSELAAEAGVVFCYEPPAQQNGDLTPDTP